MTSKRNLAYNLMILFIVLHFGSSQYLVPLVPQPRLGFGILSSLFSGLGGNSCSTSNSQSGTCLDFSRCSATGGTASGSCGFGFKTCCLPASQVTMSTRSPTSTTTTTTTTSTTQTPIVNEYLIKDSPTKLQDALTIKRISSSYCQLRIDFEAFDIDPTNVDTGVCETGGRWTVTGQMEPKENVPDLCGKNSGQHMYLRFDGETPIEMRLVTTSLTSYWKVKTTQLECTDQRSAPEGCLQFFTDIIGFVKSFNYQNTERTNQDAYQLANLNYVVCIEMAATPYSTITWIQDTTSHSSFTLTDNLSSILNLDDLSAASTTGMDCKTDYVEIETTINLVTSATKYCGLGFPKEVKSTPATKPFKLTVKTDGTELPLDDGNVGFSLKYVLS